VSTVRYSKAFGSPTRSSELGFSGLIRPCRSVTGAPGFAAAFGVPRLPGSAFRQPCLSTGVMRVDAGQADAEGRDNGSDNLEHLGEEVQQAQTRRTKPWRSWR